MVRFETLANELIFDVFDYLDASSLIDAFFGLNIRLNHLVSEHLCHHPLNLQSISKNRFDRLCREVLPTIINQVLSLCLSSDETPNLAELLLDRGFTLDRFVRLRSLMLTNINSINTLVQLISTCRSLTELTQLKITQQERYFPEEETYLLLGHIWNLPHLINCHLNGITKVELSLKHMSQRSVSMDSLWMNGLTCTADSLFELFQWTPYLTTISITIYSYIEHACRLFQMPLITTCLLYTSPSPRD